MSPRIALIAGAGPAGLTAAYELLARTDVVPVVCEMTADLGGAARTVRHHGNRMDVGGHRFFTREQRVLDWWERVLPTAGGEGRPGPDPEETDQVMLVRDRRSSIFFDGRFFPYPLTLDPRTLGNLGARRLAEIALSYGKSRLFPVPERNLEDFFVNRFGRSLYNMFFRDYTQKVWGRDATDILPQWGSERVRGLSVSSVAAHALSRLARRDRTLAQAGTQVSLVERFLYPKYGPGQLWESVAADVRGLGGKILLHHKVKEVRLEGNRVRAVRLSTPDGFVDVEADFLFSTMPVRYLVRGMSPGAPMAVAEAAEELVHRNFLAVGLLADPRKTSPRPVADASRLSDLWLYIQDRQRKLARVQIFNNWSPWLLADPSLTWLAAEYFTGPGDPLQKAPDEPIVRMATRELCALGLLGKNDVADSLVVRQKDAYPAYFAGFRRFPLVRAWLDSIENLFCIGRSGMHRYNNMDHSMLTAMLAVDALLESSPIKDPIWDAAA